MVDTAIIGTLIVGATWFGSGFLAHILLKGLLCEVLPKTGEKYDFKYERRCNYAFWFGIMGLVIVFNCYKAFGVKRPRFCLIIPKELRE
jgi:hypothetical protein